MARKSAPSAPCCATEDGEAEYLLCINLNVSVLEQARAALDAFFQMSRLVPQPDSLFRNDWQERINTFLHAGCRNATCHCKRCR